MSPPSALDYAVGDDGIVVVTIDRPDRDVNVLSIDVARELAATLDRFAADGAARGLVITSGKEGQFIVGADIGEIEGMASAAAAAAAATALQALFGRLAALPVPVVAAIGGACLGGGLELALACDWRVADTGSKTRLGLPEIQLGLIPGGGGTQRLPRLVGSAAGLRMILTGERIDAVRALRAGLVDAAPPPTNLLETARGFIGRGKRPPRWRAVRRPLGRRIAARLLDGTSPGRRLVAWQATRTTRGKTKGFYPAPPLAIDVVMRGLGRPLAEGLKLEADAFGSLVPTREAQSLIHLFHATTAVKKQPYAAAGAERYGTRPIETIGVVGAGFMGSGIATVCVEKGIRVLLADPGRSALGKALAHAASACRARVARKRMKPFEMERTMARLSPGLEPSGFQRCDLVIEAAFEDLSLKRRILADLEKRGPGPDWVFASNTSALPIGAIAAEAHAPERVLGMHFFSPVEKMPLLEVVVTERTAPWAAARACELGVRMNKQVIVVRDGPGFYTTRALSFLLAEACWTLAEGASITTIDRALTDRGFPVGPLALIDEVGIDVGMHVMETMQRAFPQRLASPPGLAALAASGRVGRKNGRGFYRYGKGRKVGPDPEIGRLVGRPPAGTPIPDARTIAERCLLVFVNESARCLEEGILPDAYAGDVGAVFGLGFPPFLGGPFKWVDHEGAAAVVERLEALQRQHGARFAPARTLVDHATAGTRFFPREAAAGR